MQAAVKAKLMAAAVPNMAARHHRGPRRASTTATAIPPLQAPPAITQLQKDGDRLPSSGWAQYKKPERPPTAASEPSHSRRPTEKPNQTESTITRKTNSRVRMGCTCERRPKCRAMAWSMKETIIRAKPRSQMPRLTA